MIHFKGLQCTALFSDTTEGYVTPYEPRNYDVIKIKFRTLKGNVRNVDIVINQKSYRMNFFRQEGIFDYYDCNYQLEGENISYYFRVETDQETCFYDQRGVVYDIQSYYWFKIIPGFSTPDWAKGAVMYQIYTDRFYNGDKTNDVLTNEYFYIGDYVIRNEDWYQLPREFGVREFYGGDLSGVLQKLDYLEELGVEVLYFNPLFVSPSSHKYDIQDYDYIDPHFTVIKDDGGELLELGKHVNRYATKYRQRVIKIGRAHV